MGKETAPVVGDLACLEVQVKDRSMYTYYCILSEWEIKKGEVDIVGIIQRRHKDGHTVPYFNPWL